jgi:hypothetical protein
MLDDVVRYFLSPFAMAPFPPAFLRIDRRSPALFSLTCPVTRCRFLVFFAAIFFR